MWVCYYHAVWATKYRQPFISPEFEKIIFPMVIAKSRKLGCQVFAVNGMPDHLHVAVSIPPKWAGAWWLKNIKGSTSYEINQMFPNQPSHFQWQGGYSLQTFGVKNLHFVVNYIENQKTHHANNTTEPYMEDYGDEGDESEDE